MRSLHRTSRASKPARQRPTARLRLEELEPRNLLSVFTPAQIKTAYNFTQATYNGTPLTGAGQTIAIVDAYDDPNAQADLNTFSKQFGLPIANFTKATPGGMPAADAGWATEIALDIEWAHAIAPGAKILLVEAKSNSLGDLLAAVDYARKQPGVSVVSMSWGAGEFSSETFYDSYFTTPANHTGVTFVASSGDDGAWYGAEWPAASPNVVSVGGTTLKLASSSGTYGSESGWSGSGGGYSAVEKEPSYQKSVQSSGKRTTPDVSYDANPNTGFYVYMSYGTTPGWYQIGGTSAGAPQWAALVALANQQRSLMGKTPLDGPTQTLPALYSMPSSYFHDITTGNNGYSAHSGYDLVTGRGSPYANLVISALANYNGSATAAVATSSTGTTGGTSGKRGHRIDIVAESPPAGTPGSGTDSSTGTPVSTLGQAPFAGLFVTSTQVGVLPGSWSTMDTRASSFVTFSLDGMPRGVEGAWWTTGAHVRQARPEEEERTALLDQVFADGSLLAADIGPDADLTGDSFSPWSELLGDE